MKSLWRRYGVLALGWLTLTAQAQAPDLPAVPKRGVNIVGYDPIWKSPEQARFQSRHFAAIRAAGFDHVRLNLHAFEHMDAQGRLSPQWFTTLDRLVEGGLKAGLQVIIDEHNFNECNKPETLADCRRRLLAFWEQVATRYRESPDNVLFEILNEPNGAMDAVWNEVLAENLAVIRASNPNRRVVVGPRFWNNLEHLDHLRLPENDRRLILTFHYYTPMEFTHQGAPWVPQFQKLSGVGWGSASERERMDKDFDIVKAWAERQRRPVLMGEFGAYDKAEMGQRVAWTSTAARAAEARGFGWSYWQFDSDFIVWDMAADGWVQPILGALIPERAGATKAAARDPALDHLINTASVSTWQVYGEGQSSAQVPCAATGKACLRVALSGRKPNPWDIGAIAPVQGAIRKGDKLQVLLWARLDSDDPKAQAQVNLALQLGQAPYTTVISTPVTLGTKLEPVVLAGQAQESFNAGSVNLVMHLGQLGQPLWLSAPYVLKNYDPGAAR